jgi:hypothetical protein
MSLGSLQRLIFLNMNGIGRHICSNVISLRKNLFSSSQTRQQMSMSVINRIDQSPKFGSQGIEPELGQPLIGAHKILL